MRGGFRAGLLAAAALLVLGCSARFEAFGFQTAEGARDRPPAVGAQGAGQGGDLPALGGPSRFSRVYPRKPLTVAARGQAFAISYTSSLADCTLTIFVRSEDRSQESDPARVERHPSSDSWCPLPRATRIWGFQLSDPARELRPAPWRCAGSGRRRSCMGSRSKRTD